jgi:glycosyltransferase involved in cell wall biosynthesis
VTSEPRVLFVDQTGDLGGAEFCLADLATHLKNRCVVLLFEPGPFRTLLEENGVRTIVLEASALKATIRKNTKLASYLLGVPGFIWLVIDLLRQARGFDLVYSNTAKATVVTAVAARLLRKPFVVHLHDVIDAGHFSRLNRWLLVTAANLASGVVANSEATAKAYREAGGRNANLAVVPNGFREERFRVDVQSRSREIRGSMGVKGGSLVGLFGRIAPWKGQKILIEALPQLPEVSAVIVGEALFTEEDRQYKRELVDLAGRLGVQDRIHFAGFQRDVVSFLKAVDLVVHCSISAEPFGRVIVEALLAGRPVIATRLGGPAEIIEDRVTGILVRPGNPTELAQAIRELLADPPLAEKLVVAGGQAMSRRFGLEQVLREWTEFVHRSFYSLKKRSGGGPKRTEPNSVERSVELTKAECD